MDEENKANFESEISELLSKFGDAVDEESFNDFIADLKGDWRKAKFAPKDRDLLLYGVIVSTQETVVAVGHYDNSRNQWVINLLDEEIVPEYFKEIEINF